MPAPCFTINNRNSYGMSECGSRDQTREVMRCKLIGTRIFKLKKEKERALNQLKSMKNKFQKVRYS